MYVSPFLSTPQARACGVGNMPGIYDGELAVYFHPSSPKFPICAFCYETYIAPSTFASSFAGKKARKTPCGFHVPRITRVLWPKACATGDLEPLIEYMRRRSSGTMSCCGDPGPKPASAKIKWFVAKDSSALDENAYTICEGCYEDSIGGGPWETRFAERPGWHPEGASCDGWNQSAMRLIFKGDWEKFVAHVKLRLSLPECDGEFRQGAKWWKIRGCDTIDICERCYVDRFKDSRWEGIVEPKVVEPRVVGSDAWWEGNGDLRACDLHPKHNINLGFAVVFADERKLGAEELRQSLLSIASKPVCGKKKGFVNGRFYNVRGTPIPNYGVCEACYESRIVLPGLAEFFTDQPSVVPGEKWCVDSVEGRKWWGWTNCTACPWHYHMVLAGSRFESQMTLRAVQARPNEPGMCHFYSTGQQRRYQEACDSGKLDEFFAFTEKRLLKWCELMPTINRLKAQIMNTEWASVHASIRSHGDRMSAAIDFGTSTKSYVSSSGNRYNSLYRRFRKPREVEKRALEVARWTRGRPTEEALREAWEERWKQRIQAQGRRPERPADWDPPDFLFTDRALARHQGLTKAQSSLLTQARAGAVGLRGYLFRAKVPGVNTPHCACGQGEETVEHLVVWCQYPPRPRPWDPRAIRTRLDLYYVLRGRGARAQRLAKGVVNWLLQSGRLPEYRLAARLDLGLGEDPG
ncbi:hypothetical protein VTJ04DRAFT_165 [Mycothermus thermophilus]|uniref:uncharacterized protein n=1 Tax=Humicola insolens TaxID=85995 RepID=UPI003743D2B0